MTTARPWRLALLLSAEEEELHWLVAVVVTAGKGFDARQRGVSALLPARPSLRRGLWALWPGQVWALWPGQDRAVPTTTSLSFIRPSPTLHRVLQPQAPRMPLFSTSELMVVSQYNGVACRGADGLI
jgi:hypothetical protein